MPKCLSIALILCGLAVAGCAADAGSRAFREAKRAERLGDHLRAYFLYAEAAQADARNPFYSRKLAALAQSSALHPRTQTIVQPAIDPAIDTIATHLQAEGLIGEESLISPAASPPPRLVVPAGKRSYKIKGTARAMFEQVAAACRVRLLFEPDYREPAPFTFAVEDVGCQEALRALEAATDSFVVPVGERTALVARDTQPNRVLLTPVIEMAVPIPERTTLQEAQELATSVQQTLDIRRISMDAARRVVYFRDAAAKVFAAREMFADLSRLRAQIEVDVEFLAVSKNSSLAYGLTLPTSAAIVNFGSGTISGPIAPLQQYGLGITNSVVLATLTRSSTMSLLESQIVALDGQPVSMRVGDRYPLVTSTYSGLSGSALGSAGIAPGINYQDLGFGLKLTAAVHDRGEVSLDIDAAYTSLGATDANGNPSISNQQFQGKVRLQQGEWAVVAGLLQITHTNNPTGIAGLSSIPLLGNLFRSQTREDDRSEILLVLKPRIVARPPWEATPVRTIWIGTEGRPSTVF